MNEKLKSIAQAAVSAATGKPQNGKYFSSGKKGENYELKADLNSDRTSRKKEALKRIIANMTVGKDVSSLFADVVKCMQTTDMVLKKLVYLYLMNYATSQPELAILAINTFCKDTEDPNPLVRALAIRTMSSIRVEKIVDYMCEPLARSLKDPHPYVRKTGAVAVVKLYDLSPALVHDNGFISILLELLSDSNPTVIANAMVSLSEMNHRRPPGDPPLFQIGGTNLNRFFSALNDCTEWGQLAILDVLSEYKFSNEYESETIIAKVLPRLQHSNPAVVLSAIKLLFLQLPNISSPEIISSVKQKITAPFITILTSPYEQVQYVALRHAKLLVQQLPDMLRHVLPIFFCKYNDPLYIKMEKLGLLVLLASEANVDIVLDELKSYCKEVDLVFVSNTIQALGQLAFSLPAMTARISFVLFGLIDTNVPYLVQGAVLAIRDLLRSFQKDIQMLIPKLFTSTVLDCVAGEPNSRSALIWILGEYCHLIESAGSLFCHFTEDGQIDLGFEPPVIQYQVLSMAVKMYLVMPTAIHEPFVSFLTKSGASSDLSADLRDRVLVYWRLLTADSALSKEVVADGKKSIKSVRDEYPAEILQSLLAELTTLSSVYHLPLKDIPAPLPYEPIVSTDEPSNSMGYGVAASTSILVAGGTRVEKILDLDDISFGSSPTNPVPKERAAESSASYTPSNLKNELKPTSRSSSPKGKNNLMDLLGDDFVDPFYKI